MLVHIKMQKRKMDLENSTWLLWKNCPSNTCSKLAVFQGKLGFNFTTISLMVIGYKMVNVKVADHGMSTNGSIIFYQTI